MDRDQRGARDRERFDDRGPSRFGGRDDQGRGGYDRRGGRDEYDNGYGPRGGERYDDRYEPEPEPEPAKSSVADLLKPKARPVEENILKVPTKEHAENILQMPTKKQQKEEEQKPTSKPAETPAPAPEPVDVSKAIDDSSVIAEFISGNKMGEDLKSWVSGQVITSIEKLVFTLLEEKEKLNPDIDCAWAEPSKYGAALLSLVEDDLLKQVEVLVGIQKYCDKLGFPKLNGESIVQGMFRSMYKYDLAIDDAFAMWKEDESPQFEQGKMTTVIQTVEWFNWLEQDDDDEDEDYEE